jgi:uncharacterized protein involved in exopolysaccharide biosynthesis
MTPLQAAWQRDSLVNDLGLWVAMLRRRWLVVAVTFALVVLSTVICAAAWPWKYESVAKFLVRNARLDLVVDPNDKNQGAYRDSIPEEVINSEIELIRSRNILDRVVQKAQLDAAADRDVNPRVAREVAIGNLARALNVGVIRKTNLIRVAYRARDPEQAAAVLRQLSDEYLSMHLAMHSTPGTYTFFQQQTDHLKAELEQAEKELAALAGNQNLIAPADQRKEALEAGTTIERDLVAVEAEIREQTTRELAAARALQVTDARVTTTKRRMPNQGSVQSAHTMIAELQNKRTELLTKFNADDRLIKEVDEQLANTQAALTNATVIVATEEATDINPTWQKLQIERADAALQLAGLRSRAERLRAQMGAYRSRAVSLAEATPGYETLARRVSDAREQYMTYARKAEEARLADALDQQKISNVVLAETPVPALASTRPPLVLVLIVGGIAGLFLGLIAGLLTDWLGDGLFSNRRMQPAFARAATPVVDGDAWTRSEP